MEDFNFYAIAVGIALTALSYGIFPVAFILIRKSPVLRTRFRTYCICNSVVIFLFWCILLFSLDGASPTGGAALFYGLLFYHICFSNLQSTGRIKTPSERIETMPNAAFLVSTEKDSSTSESPTDELERLQRELRNMEQARQNYYEAIKENQECIDSCRREDIISAYEDGRIPREEAESLLSAYDSCAAGVEFHDSVTKSIAAKIEQQRELIRKVQAAIPCADHTTSASSSSTSVSTLPSKNSGIKPSSIVLLVLLCCTLSFFSYQVGRDSASVALRAAEEKLADTEKQRSSYRDNYFSARSENVSIREENVSLRNKNALLQLKSDFIDNTTVFVAGSGKKYHTYDCHYWENSDSFYIFNVQYARYLGYRPCSSCHPPSA